MLILAVRSVVFVLLGQIGGVGGRDVRLSDGLLAVSLGEGGIWQARPRLEEGSRFGAAGAVDARHGGPTLLAGAGNGGGRRRGAGRRGVEVVFLG